MSPAQQDRENQAAVNGWFGEPALEPTWEELADDVFAKII